MPDKVESVDLPTALHRARLRTQEIYTRRTGA